MSRALRGWNDDLDAAFHVKSLYGRSGLPGRSLATIFPLWLDLDPFLMLSTCVSVPAARLLLLRVWQIDVARRLTRWRAG